jgi:hypothetical protein
MSDHEQVETRAGLPAVRILTPQAAAIAAFTFAVLTMLGQGAWSGLVQSFLFSSFAADQYATLLVSSYGATLVLDGFAFWLAHRALSDPVAAETWAGHLARAAVVVAVVAVVIAAIALIVTVTRGVS